VQQSQLFRTQSRWVRERLAGLLRLKKETGDGTQLFQVQLAKLHGKLLVVESNRQVQFSSSWVAS